jgi:beta-glucosidase
VSAPTDGSFTAEVTVTNTGACAGTDVVQLYGRDLVASVTRPVVQLLGYTRVCLEPGESKRVAFEVPTSRFAFSGRDLNRIVEPGDMEVWVGAHAAAIAAQDEAPAESIIAAGREAVSPKLPGDATGRTPLTLTGAVHQVTTADPRYVAVKISG